jgi:hypothetical protein
MPICLLLLLAAPPEEAPRPALTLDQLHPGMTARQVRALLGPPRAVARQGFYLGRLEQWVYDRPLAVRIDFLGRAGKEPRIQSVRRLPAPAGRQEDGPGH